MKKFRKGNDLRIVWRIFSHRQEVDGDKVIEITEAYNLEGKDLSLKAVTSSRKVPITILSVVGNEITAVYYGKDQKYSGTYTIILVENDGKKGMFTIDESRAFTLVEESSQINDCDNDCCCQCGDDDDFEINPVVELSSTMDIGLSILGGGSIAIDSALSTTSENAVQNKVVTNAINEVRDIAECAKTTAEQASQDVDALEEQVEGISLGGFVWKEQS